MEVRESPVVHTSRYSQYKYGVEADMKVPLCSAEVATVQALEKNMSQVNAVPLVARGAEVLEPRLQRVLRGNRSSQPWSRNMPQLEQ